MSHSAGRKFLKVTLWIIGVIIGLPLLVAALLYVPPIQNWVVDVACRSISRSSGMDIYVHRIHLRFPLKLRVDSVRIIEASGDTMATAATAEVRVAVKPLLKGDIAIRGFRAERLFYQLGNADSAVWLRARVKLADLDNGLMNFSRGVIDVGDAQVDGASVSLAIKDTVTEERVDSAAPKPLTIKARSVTLTDVDYTMTLPPVIDVLSAHVARATLCDGLVDLLPRRIDARSFRVDGVTARYIYPPISTDTARTEDSTAATPLDEMWLITADSVSLTAPYALYALRGASPIPGFDVDYIEARDTRFDVVGFRNQGPTITVPLKHLRSTERCGLTLTASGTFVMDTLAMHARDFSISTDHSRMTLDATMGMGDLAKDPALPLRARLKGVFSGTDAATFMPALAPAVAALPAPRDLIADIDADGTPARLLLRRASLSMPGVLALQAHGAVTSLTDPAKTGGNITLEGKVTDPRAVNLTLAKLKADSALRVPALTLTGTVDYRPGLADGKINLTTGHGALLASGSWKARSEGYDAHATLTRFPIDAFMPSLGVADVTARLDVTGRGYNPLRPATSIKADVALTEAIYLGKTYSDASLKAEVGGGNIAATLISANPGADLTLNLTARTDSAVVTGRIDGDVRDLNLLTLGLTDLPCRGSTTMRVNGTYDPRNHDAGVELDLSHFSWTYDTMQFATPALLLAARSTTTGMSLNLTNQDLSVKGIVQAPLDTVMRRLDLLNPFLKQQIEQKRLDVATLQSIIPRFNLEASMGPANLAGRYLADMGFGAQSVTLNASNDSLLHLSAFATGANLGPNYVDSLNLQVNQHGKYLIYSAAMRNGPGGALSEWADVGLRGFLADDKLAAFINQRNQQGEQGYRIGAVATVSDSLITLRLAPYDPTIAYKKWSLNEGNYLSFNYFNKQIDADLALSGNGSSLRLYTVLIMPPKPDYSPKELVVEAKDIHVSDWIAISPFAPPMSGDISADVRVHREHGELVGHATATVSDFLYDRRRVGDFGLSLDVENDPLTKTLRADGTLSVNGRQTMTISGALNDSTLQHPFMLDFSMIRFPLEVANPFLPQGTASLTGTLNGTMKITGSETEPVFDGFLQFDSASVKVDIIGTRYDFSTEKIPVDSNIVKFSDFGINTLNNHPLTVNGTADINDLTDVGLDLKIAGSDMLMVNSNRARAGADIYGKGFFDIDATVKGHLQNWLACNARVALLAGSNLTYVMTTASSALTSYSTEDMVKFVSFSDSLQVALADSVPRTMNLFLDANLDVQPNTTINVDISSDGKNRAQIQGSGSLNFNMAPQNSGRLVGRYTIEEGFVRYTPPLMSEKNFKFLSGSFVNFTGDMLNPQINLQAVDVVKANVTPDGGGNSRLINFNVGLSVTGTLANMNVAFNLSTDDDITIQNELQAMSADQRANQAMNLLLYNSYTGPGSKATANLSGNPLYAFLASQLNSFTANYIKGVDLTFGIDQYDKTVGGTSSTSTTYSYQMSKSLLDNRIRIVVGGNYTTDASTDENFAENLINDISFEYLLNRTGSMYVRIFRHTGYESILEGEVTATGVGFVYKRNLTTLRDMFRFGRRKQQPASPAPPTGDSTGDSTGNEAKKTDK